MIYFDTNVLLSKVIYPAAVGQDNCKFLSGANAAAMDVATLKRELAAFVLARNHAGTTINFRFTSIDPRSALKHLYPSTSLGYPLVMGK